MNPIFHELFQLTRSMSKELNNVLKEHDLFNAQWTVLFCIQKHEEMMLKDICTYLNVEAPTITRTVNRLQELGWITITPGEDKREKIVRLSDDAKRKFPSIEKTVINFENQFLQQLSNDEQSVLLTLLQKLDMKG